MSLVTPVTTDLHGFPCLNGNRTHIKALRANYRQIAFSLSQLSRWVG